MTPSPTPIPEFFEARLVYDSALGAGAEPGRRSALLSDRTLLFRARDISISLVLHRERQPDGFLYGRVLEVAGERPLAGRRVEIRGEPGHAVTDIWGEFCLDCPSAGKAHRLCIQNGPRGVALTLPADPPGTDRAMRPG